jgi:glycosyltransferase involved in cell wall biosynthesis
MPLSNSSPEVVLVPDLPTEGWVSMDRYADRLLGHLLGSVDEEIRVKSALQGNSVTSLEASGDPIHQERVSTPTRMWRRYHSYPRMVSQLTGDIFHILDHSYAHLVPRIRKPCVVTVHDLHPLQTLARKTRGLSGVIRNRYLTNVLAGLRQADCWIVGSEWMKSGLIDWLGTDDNIFVAPYGVDREYFQDRDGPRRAATRNEFSIPSECELLLHVGSTVPRKNLPMVMNTLAALRDLGRDVRLLQVGGAPQKIESLALDAGVSDRVIAAGKISEPSLRATYAAADVFIIPSTYEGFGLPVLEAMASGLPVVGSGAGGMNEAAGGAAQIIKNGTAKEYADHIVKILEDVEVRRNLESRGLEHARKFTWERMASLTAEVYLQLLDRH